MVIVSGVNLIADHCTLAFILHIMLSCVVALFQIYPGNIFKKKEKEVLAQHFISLP